MEDVYAKEQKQKENCHANGIAAVYFCADGKHLECTDCGGCDPEVYIKINKGTNVVTVYEQNGKPYVAFTCSTGYATPVGTFHTMAKYRWWTLDGPSYGQYCTRITGSILFHSVWYYQQTTNSQSYTQYNKLGTTASHGCCRLTVAASKWIYDNCPQGTRITIYNSNDPGPLGKPVLDPIPSGQNYDPSDPSI